MASSGAKDAATPSLLLRCKVIVIGMSLLMPHLAKKIHACKDCFFAPIVRSSVIRRQEYAFCNALILWREKNGNRLTRWDWKVCTRRNRFDISFYPPACHSGDAAVGKSAIVQMFHSKGTHYPKQYAMTTGCDFVMKELKVSRHACLFFWMLANDVCFHFAVTGH